MHSFELSAGSASRDPRNRTRPAATEGISRNQLSALSAFTFTWLNAPPQCDLGTIAKSRSCRSGVAPVAAPPIQIVKLAQRVTVRRRLRAAARPPCPWRGGHSAPKREERSAGRLGLGSEVEDDTPLGSVVMKKRSNSCTTRQFS
jgi:hypothetical protein